VRAELERRLVARQPEREAQAAVRQQSKVLGGRQVHARAGGREVLDQHLARLAPVGRRQQGLDRRHDGRARARAAAALEQALQRGAAVVGQLEHVARAAASGAVLEHARDGHQAAPQRAAEELDLDLCGEREQGRLQPLEEHRHAPVLERRHGREQASARAVVARPAQEQQHLEIVHGGGPGARLGISAGSLPRPEPRPLGRR
jgi:hypothetical protein